MAIFQEHKFFYFHILISFSRCDTDMYAKKNDNGEVKEYEVNVYQVQEKRD